MSVLEKISLLGVHMIQNLALSSNHAYEIHLYNMSTQVKSSIYQLAIPSN